MENSILLRLEPKGREIWTASSLAPKLRQIASSIEYLESSSAEPIAPNAIVSDADSTDFSGGKLTIGFETEYLEGDQLLIRNRGSIKVINNNVFDGESIIGRVIPNGGRSVTIALNLNANAASLTKVIQAVAFRSDAVDVSLQPRRIALQLLDGDSGASDVRTVEVLIKPNLAKRPHCTKSMACFSTKRTIATCLLPLQRV